MGKKFNEELQKARSIDVDSKYYAESYQKNIYGGRMGKRFVGMFREGGGKELLPKDGKKEKAACIYSSSMLAYNFFSWIDENHPLHYDGIDYVRVVFEEQFRVLKNRNNRANIDVVLTDRDGTTLLLLESKFTEHMAIKHTCQKISDAYCSKDSYFSKCKGDEWVSVINDLCIRDRGRVYYDGLKQVVCHLIGISNVISNSEARKWFNDNSWLKHVEGITLRGDEKYIFKSIVFHPITKEEGKRSENYEKLNRDFVKNLQSMKFLPDNLDIADPILTYRDLWNAGMKDSLANDRDLTAYLEKYLAAHQ